MCVSWFILLLGLQAGASPLVTAHDVTQTHAERAAIKKMADRMVNAYLQNDKRTLLSVTTSYFYRRLKPPQKSLPEGRRVALRDFQLVDDGAGLLLRMGYDGAPKMPTGMWYRLKKEGGEWKVHGLTQDYEP